CRHLAVGENVDVVLIASAETAMAGARCTQTRSPARTRPPRPLFLVLHQTTLGVRPELERQPPRMEDASAVRAHVSHATAN
ncbi:hypothetical protein L2E82_36883, partial [Cichorium intybus]